MFQMTTRRGGVDTHWSRTSTLPVAGGVGVVHVLKAEHPLRRNE